MPHGGNWCETVRCVEVVRLHGIMCLRVCFWSNRYEMLEEHLSVTVGVAESMWDSSHSTRAAFRKHGSCKGSHSSKDKSKPWTGGASLTFLCPQTPPPFSLLATAGLCCHPWLLLTAANTSGSCNRVALPKGRNTHCHDLGAWEGWEWSSPGAQDRKNADASSPCETFSCLDGPEKSPGLSFQLPRSRDPLLCSLLPSPGHFPLAEVERSQAGAKATSYTIPWLGWGSPGSRTRLS